MITQKYLKSILNYDKTSGEFAWAVQKASSIKVGAHAGNLDKVHGYVLIRIDNVNYRAHRLAWLYMTGNMPKNMIDHKDRVKHNNSWLNLRCANNFQNGMNVNIQTNNKTGFKGVSYCKLNKKFRAQAKVLGKNKTLGYFITAEDASVEYQRFTKELHGEFYHQPEPSAGS